MTWDDFFVRLAARPVSRATQRSYEQAWRLFLRQWPELTGPRDIDEQHLSEFHRQQRTSPRISESTAGQRLRCLLTTLRWARRQGHLLLDPGESLSVPKPRWKEGRWLSVEQVQRLLLTPLNCHRIGMRYRDRALLELLYATGMRAGEVAALDLDDLDLAGAELSIRGGKGRPRRMPLLGMAVTALERYLNEARPALALEGETAVFVSFRGLRLTAKSLGYQVRLHAEKLGLRGVTPHVLRRSLATHLLENGASVREIQAVLGHADLASTQTYARVLPVELAREHRRTHPRAYRRKEAR